MVDWLTGGREHARRVEALERELETLRTKSASEAAHREELSQSLGSLVEGQSAVSETLPPLQVRTEALVQELESLKTKAEAEADRLDALSRSVDSLFERLSTVAGTLSPLQQRVSDDRDEIARTRSSMMSIMAAEAERSRELSTTVESLRESVEALEAAALPEALSAMEKRAKTDREELVMLRTAVLRLERQLELYAEEARKTGLGLLERLERMRAG